MNKFKSFTEFEDFVEQTCSEYLEQTKTILSYETNINRFIIQLNTNLKNRGFEILNSDPAPPESDVRARIKYRLVKGGINPRRLEEYDNVIQKHIDNIEKGGE